MIPSERQKTGGGGKQEGKRSGGGETERKRGTKSERGGWRCRL